MIFEIRLEFICSLICTSLERMLIGTKATVGRRQPWLEVVVDVIESDSERRAVT